MESIAQLLGLAVVVAMLVGCLSGWKIAFQNMHAGRPILRSDPRRPTAWGMLDLLLLYGFLVGCQVVSSIWLRRVYDLQPGTDLPDMTPDQQLAWLFANSTVTLIAALLSVITIRARTGCSLRDLGVDPAAMGSDMKLGLIAFLMIAPPVLLLQMTLAYIWKPTQHPLILALQESKDAQLFLVSGYAAVLVAPVFEEYAFRVLLQGWLERLAAGGCNLVSAMMGQVQSSELETRHAVGVDNGRQGPQHRSAGGPEVHAGSQPAVAAQVADKESGVAQLCLPVGTCTPILLARWPILVSALIFAAMHWGHGPDPLPLFFLAVGLGYLYQRTHRILPCILVHFLLNGFTFVLLYFDVFIINSPPA